MLGEAKQSDRPKNSLLNLNLSFEHNRQIDTSSEDQEYLLKLNDIETLIKERIADKSFDDIVKKDNIIKLLDKTDTKDDFLKMLNKPIDSLSNIYEKDFNSF